MAILVFCILMKNKPKKHKKKVGLICMEVWWAEVEIFESEGLNSSTALCPLQGGHGGVCVSSDKEDDDPAL